MLQRVDFINCCYIKNASAKVFDGPLKTSAAVGLAEEGEGVKYPFGVAAVEGSRACILHDVLDSVWIEIAELEPVCVHLRHPNCSSTLLGVFNRVMHHHAIERDLASY